MNWTTENTVSVIIIVAVALVVFLICRFIIPPIMKRALAHRMAEEDQAEITKRSKTLSSVLIKLVGVIILVVAIVTLLPQFNVDIAPLIAAIGVGGLAIAFAAQSLVKDFICGFFVIMEDQYRIGDVVSIAGSAGTVEDITLRRTVMRDVDGNVHSIPNGKVEISMNMTRKYSRVNLNISVGYGEDLNHVMEIMNRVCKAMAEDPQWKDDFITTPAVVRVDKLGDSGIDIKIMGDTKPARQWALMGELRLRLKNTFDTEAIEIPWPHTKVYFGNNPANIKEN